MIGNVIGMSVLSQVAEKYYAADVAKAPYEIQIKIYYTTLSSLEKYLDTSDLRKLRLKSLTIIINDILKIIDGVRGLRGKITFKDIHSVDGLLEKLRLARNSLQVALGMLDDVTGEISASKSKKFFLELMACRQLIEEACDFFDPRVRTAAKQPVPDLKSQFRGPAEKEQEKKKKRTPKKRTDLVPAGFVSKSSSKDVTMKGNKIFIGHGRSSLWRELKDFIQDRLGLEWDEFNRESAAGLTTVARLQAMLDQASFAFLILTAEDEHTDGTYHARENVVHESGLFQGRLGFKRAILLVEEGCKEFSNINGLTQIRFPKGDIAARFEEIRRVLEREGLLK